MELGIVDKESSFVDQVFSCSVAEIIDRFDESLCINKAFDEAGVSSKSYEQYGRMEKLYGPFCFVNITEGREEVDDDNIGRRNLVEVAVVMKLVQRLYKELCGCNQRLHVVVASPYAAQVAEIERRLGETIGHLANLVLSVKTTKELRNLEADIIILSTVKSNGMDSFELSSDTQQIINLFPRARHCLWILGNANVLSKTDPLWETVISNAKELKCFVNANQDDEMAQIISNVKRQLDELEDLLDMKSLIFKDARWKVLFSEMFVKSFSKLPSTYSKKIVLNFLLKLANGWRPKKYKTSLGIAKKYKVEGLYIICTNDICMESGYAKQVLKVWDLLHLVDVRLLVEKLDKFFRTFSNEYLKHCKDKCIEGDLEVPRRYDVLCDSWFSGISRADSADVSYGKSSVKNCNVNESLLLMKFYSFSAGAVSHLLSARDGTPINVPFEVTNQEKEIILHQSSSFVLGRSGTGKTTVLVMKLFQKEQLYYMASQGFSELNSNAYPSYPPVLKVTTAGSSLRQLFVTVNPKLCIAVKRHINNFQRYVRGETFGEEKITVDVNDMDDDENFKNIPTCFRDTPAKIYPLVVTFSMFLIMLDRTIGTSYFNRFPDIRKIYSQDNPDLRLVQNLVKRREVSYEKFRESYWPHFNMKLTNKLDPSRVFTEINTHMKGSLRFGDNRKTKLCLERYIQLSNKKGSTFDRAERAQIYEILLSYDKLKVTRGEYDLADLVNDIHRRLKHEKYEGDFMDFVYVDEVQDLTMKQLVILKYICKNVKEGFVFAGDTAQTIAKGVHFKFEDIKCLYYKEFLREERLQLDWKPSPLFNLTQNFRTHAGVLNLAQSITELLYHFFPDSIDKLDPETSLVLGESPVLLDCGCHGDAMSVIFRDQGKNSENHISFGSDQVILVRDDRVKNEITKRIGKRAIVLTIFECKGLEFQDVLLYNFFGTSPLQEPWRIIYECMDENLLLSSQESLPEFSHLKHNILCYELKQLYVAITRTKQRLWICEESGGFALPVVRYWQKLNAIEVKKLDDSYARKMPVISSSHDWKLQGLKMLEVHSYKIAAQCFEQAGEEDWGTYARASELKEAARNIRSLRLDKSIKMLKKAADLFESILHRKKAAECYFDAEHYAEAGSIYYAETDFQRAGQCYALAGCYREAAESYARANLVNECLNACSDGKLFELGLQYIQRWRENFNYLIQESRMDINAVEQKFLQKCAYAAYIDQDKNLMMKYVKGFNSFKSKQSFLKKFDCANELLELLVDVGKFIDAAKLARRLGDIVLEADLLEKGHHYHEASLLYRASLLAGSLWADAGEGWPLKDFASKEELSLKAKASASKYMPHFHEIVCSNIQLISNDKYDFHELKRQLAMSMKNRDLMGEILAVRKALDILVSEPKKSGSHFEAKIPKNKVPVSTLIWHWNCWKDYIVKIQGYLQSLNGKETAEVTEYGEFCLAYFGVRKRFSDPDDEDYFMLYPDAKWLKTVARRFDKKDSLNVWQLVNAGERYWCTELLSVGIKVLEILESVHNSVSSKFMPSYWNESVPLHIFEVAAFLIIHCRFLEQASDDWRSLTNYIDFSIEEYFRSVLSLDNKMLKTKVNIALTVASQNIWNEAICRRYRSMVLQKPTLAQLTQMVVVFLGTGKDVVSEFEMGSPWRFLSDDTVQGIDKVCHFRDVLCDLYNSKSEGYHLISPSCFLYLLNRLLLMVSCFGGCFFATRSTVIEWLIHLDWKVNGQTFLPCSEETSPLTSIFDFLAYIVHELLQNPQDTEEWVKKTVSKQSHQAQPMITSSLNTLRSNLVILLSLICLNTGRYLGLLNNVLLRSDIISRLPNRFREVIVGRSGSSFRNVIAEALMKIDDSLVVVWNPEFDTKEMYLRHAVFLRDFRSKDKILSYLRINVSPGKFGNPTFVNLKYVQ